MARYIILCIILVLSLSGCRKSEETLSDAELSAKTSVEEDHSDVMDEVIEEAERTPDETWAIYWYVCGSDLESDNGAATTDLVEALEVELQENIKLIIQTGGAFDWHNDIVAVDKSQRYLYDNEDLKLVWEDELQNMGDEKTLADFLSYCKENYSADHNVLIFWNHGGGSLGGVCYDEVFDDDSLTVDEIYGAFSDVYNLAEEEPPLELVGFDACMMSTIEVAYYLSDIAHYMVASEEIEPGIGWYYTGWLQDLVDNPNMSGEELGKAICDNYKEECDKQEQGERITLSVVDLQKLDNIMTAYDDMAKDALSLACTESHFFAQYGRSAEKSVQFGNSNFEENNLNLIDIGDFASKNEDLFPNSSAAVRKGLEECIVYQVYGKYRDNVTGLAGYYSFDGDPYELELYQYVGFSDAMKYLYEFKVNGELSGEGMSYIEDLGYESLPQIETINADEIAAIPVVGDDEGYATYDVGPDVARMITRAFFTITSVDLENGYMMILGSDDDVTVDWEKGVFKDNFSGLWGAIDGHLCCMFLNYSGDKYNTYLVPLLINGKEYWYEVAYDLETGAYETVGGYATNDDAVGSKEAKILEPGDEVTILFYAYYLEDEDIELVPTETFTVTEDTCFEDIELEDGDYDIYFTLEDAFKNEYSSDAVIYEIEGDMMYLHE